MLIARKDARAAYEKISVYEDTVMGRAARIRRIGAQLTKLWPAPPTPARPKKAPSPRGDSLPPSQSVTPAAVGLGAGTIFENGGGGSLAIQAPLPESQPAATRVRHGRGPGVTVDTLRVVAWMHSTGHRMRWLAKQLDVSKAHMQNCLLGFSKLSPERSRKLDALIALGHGGAVS